MLQPYGRPVAASLLEEIERLCHLNSAVFTFDPDCAGIHMVPQIHIFHLRKYTHFFNHTSPEALSAQTCLYVVIVVCSVGDANKRKG